MATVKMNGLQSVDGVIKKVDKEFDLDHAQRILDLQKRNPPATWTLNDDRYILDKGKIVVKPTNPTVNPTAITPQAKS